MINNENLIQFPQKYSIKALNDDKGRRNIFGSFQLS